MKKTTTKAAYFFTKNKLKNKVNFSTVQDYLKTEGYSVVFYEPDDENVIIKSLRLGEYSKTVQAFTVCKKNLKIVFMQSQVSPEDKLYLLLHEAAHIFLGHMGTNNLTTNCRLQDIEADTFVHNALNRAHNSSIVKLIIVCFTVFFAVSNAIALHNLCTTSYDKNADTKENFALKTVSAAKGAQEVFVTPSGTKFHSPECRYAKNKALKSLNRMDAMKNYSPCSICNP